MAAPKKTGGLGKGLADLLGGVEIDPTEIKEQSDSPAEKTASKDPTDVKPEDAIQYINISDIKPNNDQPRKQFDEEKIEELANSIKEHGIIQPLVVRKRGKGFEIVAGERRFRAAAKAGFKKVPCLVRELTDEQNMLLAIIENVQREDLNPIEEAEAIDKMITAYGLTQEEVSKTVGKSRPYITNCLRLLKLPAEIREMVSAGELSQGHARALINVSDAKRQLGLAKRVKEEGLSVRAVEAMAGNLTNTKKKPPKKKNKDIDQLTVEDELKKILGTKVLINQKGTKGKIEIEYYSREELERLIEALRSLA